jgi:toxin HigB-1
VSGIALQFGMIGSFRSKGLKRFAETGDFSKLASEHVRRIANILRTMMAAERPEHLDVPGFRFHRLKGADKNRYAIWVSGNFRITFAWDGTKAIDIDLEDYH